MSWRRRWDTFAWWVAGIIEVSWTVFVIAFALFVIMVMVR